MTKSVPATLFSIWAFFHDHSRITGLRGEGGGYFFHFYPFYRHLDISQEISAERSPLHIVSSRSPNENL